MSNLEIIELLFFKQVRENEKGEIWYEITYDDSIRLKDAIQGIISENDKYKMLIELYKNVIKSLIESEE